MQRIVLANVKPTSSLPEALDRMQPGTRAVVVSDGHGSRIITAGDIFEAINDALDAGKNPEDIQVAEVKPTLLRIALEAPGIGVTDRFGRPGSLPSLALTEQNHFRSILMMDSRKRRQRYIVEEIGPESTAIITSSDTFARGLAKSVTICKCAGDPVHSFEPDQVRVAGVCNKPHGSKVTCDQASDT
jgi:hypothetical protein